MVQFFQNASARRLRKLILKRCLTAIVQPKVFQRDGTEGLDEGLRWKPSSAIERRRILSHKVARSANDPIEPPDVIRPHVVEIDLVEICANRFANYAESRPRQFADASRSERRVLQSDTSHENTDRRRHEDDVRPPAAPKNFVKQSA
ncbi:MAG TPA: hypothetical protein VEV38_14195 [Candidatus Eremiobacteraceae bacterium]|nr:hypothetical protein [Candidatus Eremiobacteraceae bacterium]